jgi:hypothetical protein
MKELCDAYEMQFIIGQITGFEEHGAKLTGVKVTGSDGITRVVPLDVLLVFFGLSPKLGPIAEWGLDIERKQLKVDTEKFSTNVPGIFAVGDINIYPGKKKLILSGFHECALAAFGAAPFIFPDKKIHLQYTTTSPKLHKVLGVESPVFDPAASTGSGRRGPHVVARSAPGASGAPCCQMLAAASPLTTPLCSMGMLAQPIMVSSWLRTMNSASAPHSARITPPWRCSGCTQLRPSSTMRSGASRAGASGRTRCRCRCCPRAGPAPGVSTR